MTYKELYARAIKKGKLREDEYSTLEFIDDVNELGRRLWTTIFQGVNGNKPNAERKEPILTINNDLNYVFTRTIKKTPILKIVLDECIELEQLTDSTEIYSSCTTFEYDDDEVRFNQSVDGNYEIFYESATFVPLTQALYNADSSPDWIKDDFVPLFWTYPAFLNSDTTKDEMLDLYKFYQGIFEEYYSRTETLEDNFIVADDTSDQL